MKKPKKILQFIESGEAGGAESVALDICKELRKEGIEVITAGLNQGWFSENATKNGFNFELLESKRSYDIYLAFRIAKLAKKHQVDLIHSHLLDSNFYCSLGARIARIPHLGTEHGDIHHPKLKKFTKFKLRVAQLLGTHFCAVSNYTANCLESFGVSKNRTSVVFNPINLASTEEEINKDEFVESLGISEKPNWIWVTVAILHPVKDQQTIIRAFHQALKDDKNQILLIAGDGKEKENLEELAKNLNISENVYFLGFRDDVPKILSISDCFILSSLSEALPMALLEAGSKGLPLISSDVGGIRDIIQNEGADGILFPAGDVGQLHKSMQKLLKNPDLANKLGTKSKARIQTTFSTEHCIKRHLNLYTNLLNG